MKDAREVAGQRWPQAAVLILLLLALGSVSAVAAPSDPAATPPIKQCEDGEDNDGDGLIDFPADPSCESGRDNSEAPLCADGTDNDGDGAVDLADPGCASASDDDETDPPPPPPPPPPPAVCADGADNDGDGAVDLADPGCDSSTDGDETDPAPAPPPPPPPPPPAQCDDGADNDGDGRIDSLDPGCTSSADGDETDPPPPPVPPEDTSIIRTAEPQPQPEPEPAGTAQALTSLSPPAIVRLWGQLTLFGVRVDGLSVRAPAGSTVRVRCLRAQCPRDFVRRVSSSRLLRLRAYQRALPAGAVLQVFVVKPGAIGKYTRFRVRRGAAPLRTDACLTAQSSYPLPRAVRCSEI